MRLLSLNINNIRGIKNINIQANGQNVVIYGPNGTGKSAIVDSIDFLLTGKISRLTGEGAKVLDLKEHGPHVDSRDDLKNTIVSAKVKIGAEEITLERSIAKPSNLKVTPKESKEKIQKLLAITDLGQHILTRREILQYITAEAGKRAKKVMSLLDLDNIESLRQTLVTLKHETETELGSNQTNLEISKRNITTLLSINDFSEPAVLAEVNKFRETLQGSAITTLTIEQIKKDLKPHPFKTSAPFTSIEEIISTIKQTRTVVADLPNIEAKENELITLIEEVQKDEILRNCVLYSALIKAGINLTDETNVCPLCGRKWDGDFVKYLIEKEKETEIGKEKQEKITEASQWISQQISVFKNYLMTCIKARTQFGLQDIDPTQLKTYFDLFSSWQEAMNDSLASFENGKWPSLGLKGCFSHPIVETQIIAPLDTEVLKVEPGYSSQQLAWDNLTKLEERWRTYKQFMEQTEESDVFNKRTTLALERFEAARNSVMESIYDAVQADFEKYYKMIHGSDEVSFSAEISHEGAELKFEVDFYGRGKFPPQALHSEGHQDSMGIALFFALNAYLVKDLMEVIVLDDVVMSIDSGHRRGVCELLQALQSSRQFIITTHDSTWAKQLKTQGIVKRNNLIHFANWNIETGPIYELEKDLWTLMDEDLQKDEVPVAAARLRRNAESVFDDICESLGATIRYHSIHQWDLGEYASAALGAYKKHLKTAKNNARILNASEKLKELEKIEKESTEKFNKSQIEQWAINANVHYNKWATFSKEDFLPLISAYKDLFGLFSCSKCGGLIAYNELRGENARANVSCGCGAFFWNVSENVRPPQAINTT